jgi:hypothetical protein
LVLDVVIYELFNVLTLGNVFELLFALVLGVINIRGLKINSWFDGYWKLDWVDDRLFKV